MYVPTTAHAATRPVYSPQSQYPNVGTYAGNVIGSLAQQGMALYEAANARRNIDRVLAVNDYLAAAFALTPIGPAIGLGALAKHITVGVVDAQTANRERNSLERQIQADVRRGRRLGFQGSPAIAALVTLRRVAHHVHAAGGVMPRKLRELIRTSPFYAPGGELRDPETGRISTLQALQIKYGGGADRVGGAISAELNRRIAIGSGFVPSLLAGYRRAA